MPRVQSAINGWVRMVCGGFNTWIGAQAIEETGVAILLVKSSFILSLLCSSCTCTVKLAVGHPSLLLMASLRSHRSPPPLLDWSQGRMSSLND